MAGYGKVFHRFWKSRTVRGWDDTTRTLALYLLTSQHATSEGYFHLPIAYAAADLGWDLDKVEKAFAQLDADDFARYDPDAEVVLVVKAIRWNEPRGKPQIKGAVTRIQEAPASPLLVELCRSAEGLEGGIHAELIPLADPFERVSEPSPDTPSGGSADTPSGPSRDPVESSSSSSSSNSTPSATSADADDRHEHDPDAGDGPPGEPQVDEAARQFEEHFWPVYPARNGKKVGKANALIEWRKLTIAERRRAVTGARNLASSDQLPKDAERFLRRAKGGRGDFPFDDWQEPALPASGRDDRRDVIV
ncbi:hypothetical protein [Euzebya sp.]|uniref:hypothetical protein n=1 Tax=Euzebya sp. TaxID=1971409 RepID=UPI0035157896